MLAFMQQPTIEDAHEAYLDSFHKLPSVRARWNGRKPTLKQFTREFGEQYDRAQRKLGKQNGGSNGAEANPLVQALVTLIEQQQALTGELDEDDDQDDELDSLEDVDTDDATDALMALLGKGTANGSVKAEAEKAEQRRVRPENEDLVPTSNLIYWYIHRAIEAGSEFAIVPVRRIVASEGRGMAEDGKSYDQIIRSLRRKHS